MELQPYVDRIQDQLATVAEAGGDEARALAQRLIAPLDAAIRLTLQAALAAAAEEITCDLAPGSVELRLRGGDPEFAVNLVPTQPAAAGAGPEEAPFSWSEAGLAPEPGAEGEEALTRINLRMPERVKARVERAAGSEGLSLNSWLVRAAVVALERAGGDSRRGTSMPRGSNRYTGWAR